MNFVIKKHVKSSVPATVEKLKSLLAQKGFGVISEIDVQALMAKKLGAKYRPHVILGACNPNFSNSLLLLDKDAGVFLPCNIVVYETEQGETTVSAIDPVAAMQHVKDSKVAEIAQSVREAFEQIVKNV